MSVVTTQDLSSFELFIEEPKEEVSRYLSEISNAVDFLSKKIAHYNSRANSWIERKQLQADTHCWNIQQHVNVVNTKIKDLKGHLNNDNATLVGFLDTAKKVSKAVQETLVAIRKEQGQPIMFEGVIVKRIEQFSKGLEERIEAIEKVLANIAKGKEAADNLRDLKEQVEDQATDHFDGREDGGFSSSEKVAANNTAKDRTAADNLRDLKEQVEDQATDHFDGREDSNFPSKLLEGLKQKTEIADLFPKKA